MKKKIKTKNKKYQGGGQLLGQLAPQAIGLGLNAVVPGLGSIVSPLVGSAINKAKEEKNTLQVLTDHYNSVKTGTNPYQYMKDGGELKGSYSVPEFSGASHSQGGIQTNADGIPSTMPTAEVEDGETKYTIKGKTVVFSKSLKLKK